MRLGIVTRYQKHEAAYAAIVLANWATLRNMTVSVLPAGRTISCVDRKWDTHAFANRGCRFSDWSLKQDVVLWTHCPHIDQVRWCHQRQIRTVLFSLWHEIIPADRAVYREVQCVLSPSREAACFLARHWQLGRSLAVPWDVGLPQTYKDPRLKAPGRRILLPLFDGAARRVEMTTLEIVERLLRAYSDVQFTIAYTASVLAPYAYRRARQLRQQYARVQLVSGVSPARRPHMFQRHDLTLWLTQAESTGMLGLTSLAMGVPVAAFRFPPLHEFLNEQNSIFVQGPEDVSPLGVSICRPDYTQFEETLHVALKNPDYLRMLQQTVATGLEPRRAAFHDTLARVLC